ncbi:peroxidase [Lithospermum erythrorhizon]|uniref:Peroxidase n=1 Tax=Lithospermum erythrorhizon TaxID=34254 RepID=A0AAV3RK07_LITER
MGLFKKFAGFLGLSKDEELENRQQNAESNTNSSPSPSNLPPFANNNNININRRGFSVPVDRGPVLVQCSPIDGGIQGLRWFARRLKIDEDGDVADEFFEEVLPAIQDSMDAHIPVRKIEEKFVARPAKVRKQVLSPEGKLQHCVENQGRLQWI